MLRSHLKRPLSRPLNSIYLTASHSSRRPYVICYVTDLAISSAKVRYRPMTFRQNNENRRTPIMLVSLL